MAGHGGAAVVDNSRANAREMRRALNVDGFIVSSSSLHADFANSIFSDKTQVPATSKKLIRFRSDTCASDIHGARSFCSLSQLGNIKAEVRTIHVRQNKCFITP